MRVQVILGGRELSRSLVNVAIPNVSLLNLTLKMNQNGLTNVIFLNILFLSVNKLHYLKDKQKIVISIYIYIIPYFQIILSTTPQTYVPFAKILMIFSTKEGVDYTIANTLLKPYN